MTTGITLHPHTTPAVVKLDGVKVPHCIEARTGANGYVVVKQTDPRSGQVSYKTYRGLVSCA